MGPGFDLVFMDEEVHLSRARFNVVCVDLVPTRRLMEYITINYLLSIFYTFNACYRSLQVHTC